MNIGIIGLGKMGSNMIQRLLRDGHRCWAYDLDPGRVGAAAKHGAQPAGRLDELVQALPRPRALWVMLPAGDATESMIQSLGERLDPDDVVVDGGNSYFKEGVRRSKLLQAKGIGFLDVGTSGGIWGLERGYCLMIGGDARAFEFLQPIFASLAPGRESVTRTEGRAQATAADSGYLHCGPAGSGHFVKMVHNGIEYGLMQAFAEGFDILENAASPEVSKDYRYRLNLGEIAEVWRRGSVVSSWLLDLLAIAMNEDPRLSAYRGFVHDSGEGRWTVQAAIEESVPAEVISASLYARFRSRKEHTFAEKALSAMRRQFGGHVEESPVQREPGAPSAPVAESPSPSRKATG